MAVYKVPQDVEAEDKLLGPFSFRQFIYLIVAIMGVAIAWGLGQVFIPLAIIPLPIIVFFGALALPLKKDQPMEIYLIAVLSFYLKPRRRLWQADGVQSLVEIVAPKIVEEQRTKDLSQGEAERRLTYLANLVDSRGWAVRGVDVPQADNAMQADVFFAAQQTVDTLDDDSSVAHTFDTMIDQADAKRRQDAINLMTQPAETSQIPPVADPYAALAVPSPQPAPVVNQAPVADPQVNFNPYPEAMRQAVIRPSANPQEQSPVQPIQAAPATSQPLVSPDIMSFVNNSSGLSVETVAREVKRIHDKEEQSSDGVVVISLRSR
jgi:hypothetical protein